MRLKIFFWVVVLFLIPLSVNAIVYRNGEGDASIIYYNDFENEIIGNTSLPNITGTYAITSCGGNTKKCLSTSISPFTLVYTPFDKSANNLIGFSVIGNTSSGAIHFEVPLATDWIDAFRATAIGGDLQYYSGSWQTMGIGTHNANLNNYTLLQKNADTQYQGCRNTTCSATLTGVAVTNIVNYGLNAIIEIHSMCVWNLSKGNSCPFGVEIEEASPDTTPPQINQNSYNMTSEGGAGCVNWRTDTANPCSTSDTTPTVNFTTNENAWCAIGTQSINFTQYVNLGVDRNCTIGQGTSSHTCTLIPDDELTFANSNIYISCRDSNGNENATGKSTSGPLSLTITGLEAGGDTAIGIGVQNALLSGYSNYTNQQIYARKLDGTQDFGRFDWMAKKGNKVWAFNYITNGEEHVGLFNLTPVLYVLEMSNITNSTIINKVELMINATK